MTDEIEALAERLRAANPSSDGPTTLEDEAADALTSLSIRVKELEEGLRELESAVDEEIVLMLCELRLQNAMNAASALLQKDKA